MLQVDSSCCHSHHVGLESEPKFWQGVLGAEHGPQKEIPRDLRSDSTCFFGLSSMEHVGLAKQLGHFGLARSGMF